MAQHYRCALCNEEFTAKDMNVDHIKPIGRGLDWNEFINRLYCETSNLQAVCVPCHKIKSKAEK